MNFTSLIGKGGVALAYCSWIVVSAFLNTGCVTATPAPIVIGQPGFYGPSYAYWHYHYSRPYYGYHGWRGGYYGCHHWDGNGWHHW
jgi:hypothetical protein